MTSFLATTAKIGGLLSEYRCIICSNRCPKEPAICNGCKAILPWLDPSVCLFCGAIRGFCRSAQCSGLPVYTNQLAVFNYAFPIDALLKRFKYQEKRAIGRSLGLLLGYAAKNAGFSDHQNLLLPVPLALPRRRQRGFNQALDIAEACAEVVKVPCSDQLLKRSEDTERLAGLTPIERRFALLGAFSAADSVANKHVVLIDDVMTSGATCLELTRELLDRGATGVSVWTIARAVHGDLESNSSEPAIG